MSDERYVRKGYKIWDTYSDKELQELNYRYQSDYMCEVLNEKESRINTLVKENEKLHHELQQIKEYLQTKIDECENHKKMKEIVFGVEQAVGYEKALLSFQKGLKRRLNDE